MRFTAVLLVAAMLALSGCFGKDKDNGDETTPTPTPTTATPTGGTTATPTTTPTTPTTPTGPVVLPPKEVCTITFAFTTPPSAPQAPHAATTCTVPTGYTKLTFNGNFTGTAPAGPGLAPQGVSVQLLDPTAAVAVTCSVSGPTVEAATACTQTTGSAAPGDWKLQPVGQGSVQFSGTVVAS